MKRLFATALVAVFLPLFIGGCYTKLKGPEPGTGERYQYYDDDYYSYGSPYYCHYGWYSPYLWGSPHYYGYFYSPWWYDPWYYDGGWYYDGRARSGKEIRRRSSNSDLPPIPEGSYSPPSQGGGSGGSSAPPSAPRREQGSDDGKSDGKTTRGRR